MEDNIFTFTKISNIAFYIVGLQRIKIKNKKIADVSTAYKVFAFIFFLLLNIWLFYAALCTFTFLRTLSLSLAITFLLSQVSMSIIIFTHSIYCVGFESDVYREMYCTLLEIEKIINFTSTKQNESLKKSVTIIMLLWLIVKIFHCLLNYYTYHLQLAPYNICLCIFDFQMVRFMFEVNFIARRFEVFNYHLSRFYITENDKENFNVRDGLLVRFWRTTDCPKIKSNEVHENLTLVCNKLIEVVNMLAVYYELLVQFNI